MNSTVHHVESANENSNENYHDQTHHNEGRLCCCMDITDNDVLIVGDDDHGFKLIDEDHIGNKRFQVFLKLYGEEYRCATSENDEGKMRRIVDTVLDIVCRKCVRRGRFLRRVSTDPIEGGEKSKWIDLGDGSLAQHWLHHALSCATVESRTKDMYTEPSELFPNQERSPPTSTQCVGTAEQRNVLPSDLSCSLKRQRRGSRASLRRSFSDGAILQSLEPLLKEPREDCNLVSLLMTSCAEQAATHRTMDVVFASCRSRLAPTGNPGNARLQITIGMHAPSFGNSDILEQRRVVEDLVNTVQMHWNGRFLVQNFLGSCEVLMAEAASACIRTLLLQEGERNTVRSSTPPSSMAAPMRMSSKRSLFECDKSPNHRRDFGENICAALLLAMNPNPSVMDVELSTTSLAPSARSVNGLGCQQHLAADTEILEHHAPEIPFQRTLPPTPNVAADNKLRNAAILSLKARQKKRELMDRFFGQKKRTSSLPTLEDSSTRDHSQQG